VHKEFANWKNQYIDLIDTKPHCIFRLRTEEDLEKVKLIIRDKAQGRAIHCELGCGSGGHLIELAKNNPGKFFVGFELRFKRVFRSAEKGELLKLNNFLIVQGDALKIARVFGSNSLETIYVNFPDPWEKARWKKHRLLNSDSIAMIFDILKVSGILHYKSDHAEYFGETVSLIRSLNGVEVLSYSDDLYSTENLTGNISSEFERLFHSQGISIHFLVAKKLDGFRSSRIMN